MILGGIDASENDYKMDLKCAITTVKTVLKGDISASEKLVNMDLKGDVITVKTLTWLRVKSRVKSYSKAKEPQFLTN